jgi:hypothetical protein
MQADPIRLVIEQELALLSPDVRRSRDAVEDLLDPEFREVGASGRLWSRDETVTALAVENGDMQGETIVTELAGTVLTPDLILLTYMSDRGGRLARRVSLWLRTGGAWRVLYHQGTPLRSDDD